MKVAAILVCAITAVVGNNADIGACNCDPAEAANICAQKESDGTLVAHEYCNKFYKCSQQIPVILNCPNNLRYDPFKEMCDWSTNIDCGDRIIPEPDDVDDGKHDKDDGSSNGNPADAQEICAKDNSDGVLVAHEHCNQFYKCFSRQPVALKCPGNLLYNFLNKQCDWPANVDCGKRIIQEIEDNDDSNEDNGGGGSDNNGGNDGNGDGNDSNGDNDDNDDGNNDDNDDSGNGNPADAPEICAKDNSDGVLVAHEHCNKFYKCFSRQPVVLKCPGNLLYNFLNKQCDWPANVDCGKRIIQEIDDNDDSNEDNGGGGSDNDGGNDGNGDGNDSNDDNDDNDDANNDNNGDNDDSGDSGNGNPADAPEICARLNSDGVLVAHEYCNKFYKCFNRQPVALKCPGNLLYNFLNKQCDWPTNVDCGKRLIPEIDDHDDSNEDNGGGGNDNNGGNDDNDSNGGIDDNDDGNNDNNDDNEDSDDSGNGNPADAPEICAQLNSDGVLVAHEYCNRFYKCFNRQPVALKCPGNLLYNFLNKQCDWPTNVDCGKRLIPEIDDNDDRNEDNGGGGNDNNGGNGNNDEGNDSNGDNDEKVDNDDSDDSGNGNPADAAEICARHNSDGVLVAHEYCNRFYKCFNGQPVGLKCPSNLMYNYLNKQCDWPENVNCGSRTILEIDDNAGNEDNGNINNSNENEKNVDNGGSINGNPAEAPKICVKNNSDGVLVAHEYCNQFYKCFNGQPVAMKCPITLMYNFHKKQCDWPINVDCGSRKISEADDNDDGNNVDNGDDNKDNNHNKDPINDNPADAPEICAHKDSAGILIAHENCDQFYICNLNIPVTLSCARGLQYNPEKKWCDWPINVDCGNRIIREHKDEPSDDGDNKESCNCHPSEAPEICAREHSDGVLVAHDNCNQYYKCSAGKPNVLSCNINLLYNPNKGWCDWPEYVDCGNRIVPDNEDSSGHDNPTKASEICARAGSDGVLVAHEFCNKFFKCSHGVPVALQCQSGLAYNPLLKLCDWPRNVECGERL